MATLTAVTPTSSTAPLLGAVAAAAGGDQFVNTGREVIYLKNTNASTRTITVVTGGTAGGVGIADISFSIAQNEEKLYGPLDPRIFNNSNGMVQITYSGVTNLTVAVIKVL